MDGGQLTMDHEGRPSSTVHGQLGREHGRCTIFAKVDGEVYCTAGFGVISDWYKNMLANPSVELWLPEGKRKARAEDVTDSPNRVFLMRQVIIGSGFAGPLFGVDQRKMDDAQLDAATKDYRLIHFIISQP